MIDCNCKIEKRIPKLELTLAMYMRIRRSDEQKISIMITDIDVKENKSK